MKEVSIELFEYQELNEKAKEVVKDMCLSFKESYIFTGMILKEISEIYGIDTIDISYSLGYCQGDGACMYGNVYFDETSDTFKKIVFSDLSDVEIKEVVDNYDYICFDKVNTRYSHANTVDISLYSDCGYDEISDYLYDKVMNNIKRLYYKLCKEIEDRGYEYFFEISEQEIEEICDSNLFLFLQDGKLYN